MVEDYQSVRAIMNSEAPSSDNQVAKAYWLGSIEVGIRGEEYCTRNTTFRDFLVSSNIMDEDEEFINEDKKATQ
jgi:hypothetical protein